MSREASFAFRYHENVSQGKRIIVIYAVLTRILHNIVSSKKRDGGARKEIFNRSPNWQISLLARGRVALAIATICLLTRRFSLFHYIYAACCKNHGRR